MDFPMSPDTGPSGMIGCAVCGFESCVDIEAAFAHAWGSLHIDVHHPDARGRVPVGFQPGMSVHDEFAERWFYITRERALTEDAWSEHPHNPPGNTLLAILTGDMSHLNAEETDDGV